MRTTISLSALVIAAGLAAPALAQTATEGGKQPAKPGVQSGQQQSDSKDMTTPGTGMKPGSAEAPQGGKLARRNTCSATLPSSSRLSRVCNLVRSLMRQLVRAPARRARRVREQQASPALPRSIRGAPRKT